MNVLYVRTSSVDQRTDRQRVNEKDYDYVVEDKISGATAFFDRPGGIEIKKLVKNNIIKNLDVWEIDRLGRDLRDIINTIHYFSENKIPVKFVSQGLKTIDENGNENPITKMIISILGIVGEMERNQIKERQIEGIRIAKMKGVYTGRKIGSVEDILEFLSKEKNKKALELLRKGYKNYEVAKITELSVNTISKIKRLGLTTSR